MGILTLQICAVVFDKLSGVRIYGALLFHPSTTLLPFYPRTDLGTCYQ